MLENVELFCHNSIKITGSKTIYIDPFRLEKDYHDADYIFSTHTHYDHFSEDDIEKILKEDTVIITPDSSRELACDLTKDRERVKIVEPANEYELPGVKFSTTYAFNKETLYHTKNENWVGYIIELDGVKYYIAGDTDNIKELKDVECDVAFLHKCRESALYACKKYGWKVISCAENGEILSIEEINDRIYNEIKSILK
jgi:L-ascorbate metabolism protein UlaG (beta-lactamase superfamily)